MKRKLLKLYNPHEVGEILGVTYQTLCNWRSQSKGPSYIKIGHKIRYRQEDLDRYLNKNIRKGVRL